MAAEPELTAAELAQVHELYGDEPEADSWTPIDLNSLPEKPPTPPELGGTHLVYPGKRHVFSGPPESAKTLAAYCVLIQVVRVGGTGILIDFEMGGYDARQRLRELGATPLEISQIHYIEPDQPATATRIAQLVTLQPDLVVIDAAIGAYQLHGLDDNKRNDVETLSGLYVGIFWRNGIATILVDHVVKNTEGRGRFVIGSERKLGGADVHLGFDTITPISRGTAGRYKITTHKDRGGYLKRGHLADLQLDSDPDTNDITWSFTEPAPSTDDDGHFRPTGLMEKVSIHLQFQNDALTRNQICDAIGGTKKYVLAAITALVNEGFANEHDGANRSKLVTHAHPYREADPTCNPENTPGGSVVREWFGSGSRTTNASGGSVVRPPYGDDTARPPEPDHPNHAGWFGDNGQLTDPELAYLDTIANADDIDWST